MDLGPASCCQRCGCFLAVSLIFPVPTTWLNVWSTTYWVCLLILPSKQIMMNTLHLKIVDTAHPLWEGVGGQEAMDANKYKTFCLNKRLFHSEGGQTLEDFAQRGCGASILGSTQNWTGHSREQPALGDHAWAGQLDCQPQLISAAVTLSQQSEPWQIKMIKPNIWLDKVFHELVPREWERNRLNAGVRWSPAKAQGDSLRLQCHCF